MTTGCTVVFYHYVRDVARTPYPGIKALSTSEFAAQIDWLGSRAEILDGDTFQDAVLRRHGFSHPTALLTFDDGFVDHFEEVFPALSARKVGGMFFVSGATLGPRPRLLNVHKTHFLLSELGAARFADEAGSALTQAGVADAGAIRRDGVYRYDEAPDVRIKRLLNYEVPYPVADAVLETLFARHIGDSGEFARRLYLSEAQIREMAAGGMTFGYHTRTHPVLSRLERDAQRAELADGVLRLRELTGQQHVPFCYPYGFPHTYNRDTLNVLAECGYSVAFNTVRREAQIGSDPRFELPRFDTRDVPYANEVSTSA
jgi:peptidoglycan/xylan/chitin deacetylase (PgdA/CDA1 family)